MERLSGLVLLSIFISVLLLSPVFSENAQTQGSGAEILFFEGDVKVRPRGTDEWKEAKENMELSAGDSLKAGKESWAEVAFGREYKNIVRLKEGALIEFTGPKLNGISLLEGEARSLIESLDAGSTFEVRTPTAVCGARGTGWDTIVDPKKTIVDAYERTVFFKPSLSGADVSGGAIVEAGKRAILAGDSSRINIENLPAEKIKAWGRWKTGARNRVKIKLYVSQDPRYKEARDGWGKAMRYIKRGDLYFRKGTVQAKKMYEHAEDYLVKGSFLYKQLEEDYEVDFSREIAECDDTYRATHVKIGQVVRKLLKAR